MVRPIYKKLLGFAVIIIFAIIFISSIGTSSPSQSDKTAGKATSTDVASTDPAAKEKAQQELDEFMSLSKKAGIITSYDFSKLNDTVYRWDMYAGKAWYAQTVQQKKDFIAYIALHKKAITGYSNFKLLDGYTNEKIAEFTSFSGAIEIYK